ncbi:MAG TPA: FAD-dependent oxidoreductase [Vicinamibacterales bacterium]
MTHAVIVGAGVFGTWTAHHLHAAGHRVTLIDAYGPGHSRSSSGDESRIIRCGYGPDEVYSRLALRSLELWREFTASADHNQPLLHECGVLWLASGEDPYTQATRRTLESGPYSVRVLDRVELRTRYPHLVADDINMALLEPECGVVMARRAVRTLAADAIARGVRLVRAHVAVPSTGGPLHSVRIADGSEIGGDLFVFACGAWLPKVFPELDDVIRATRQVVIYFGTPAGDDRFGPAYTPAWVDFPAGIYGVPDLEGRGLKVGIDHHGPPIDPDHGDRTLDEDSLRIARAWLARRFPALAGAPIVESRVCQYENTSTGDFLIDRHPDHANVFIVGGGSGHGFKHAPAVGEYVARLVSTGAPVDERFSLAAKTTTRRRAVY